MKPGRTISDVVDDIGVGLAQVQLIIFAGGINLVDGTEMFLFSTLPTSVAKEMEVGPYRRAMLLSGSLAGKMVGNFASFLSDRHFARRLPILLSYLCTISFAAASALCGGYGCIVLCWALSAFGVGFGMPIWSSLASEASPTTARIHTAAWSYMLFAAGALSVLILQLCYDRDLKFGADWRELLLWAQLPCALLFGGALTAGFVDSAHALSAQGQEHKACEALAAMRRLNGRPEVSLGYEASTPRESLSLWNGSCALFSRHKRCATVALCVLTFTLNFTSYGALYAEGVMLPSLELAVPTSFILITNPISDICGDFLGMALSKVISRRTLMIGYQTAAIVVFSMLIVGLLRLDESKTDTLGQVLVIVVTMTFKGVMSIGWLTVYTAATEVYPTLCRSFGTGFVIGCGRLGSISAPLVLEHLHWLTESHWTFFCLVICLMVVNMTLVVFCLPETKDVQLEDFLGELRPLRLK